MNKLDLIGENSEYIKINDGKLICPNDNNSEITTKYIFNNELATVSNLQLELINRDWGINNRLFIKDDKLNIYTNSGDISNPNILDITNISDIINFSSSEEEYNTDNIKNNMVLELKEGKGIFKGKSIYYGLKNLYDVINESGIIDIISDVEDQTTYTSSVNLNKYADLGKNITCHISISYMKSDSELGFSDEANFLAYSDSEKINTQFNMSNDDITLDYQNGCVRIFSNKSTISDLIITNCYLTYEL